MPNSISHRITAQCSRRDEYTPAHRCRYTSICILEYYLLGQSKLSSTSPYQATVIDNAFCLPHLQQLCRPDCERILWRYVPITYELRFPSWYWCHVGLVRVTYSVLRQWWKLHSTLTKLTTVCISYLTMTGKSTRICNRIVMSGAVNKWSIVLYRAV